MEVMMRAVLVVVMATPGMLMMLVRVALVAMMIPMMMIVMMEVTMTVRVIVSGGDNGGDGDLVRMVVVML